MLRKLGVMLPALAILGFMTLPLVNAAATKTKTQTVVGTIAAVNADAKSLSIKETAKGKETGKTIDVTWTDTTKLAWKPVKKDKSTPTVADLKADAHVTVKAEVGADGKLTALTITLKST
jgi:hypothetical protein